MNNELQYWCIGWDDYPWKRKNQKKIVQDDSYICWYAWRRPYSFTNLFQNSTRYEIRTPGTLIKSSTYWIQNTKLKIKNTKKNTIWAQKKVVEASELPTIKTEMIKSRTFYVKYRAAQKKSVICVFTLVFSIPPSFKETLIFWKIFTSKVFEKTIFILFFRLYPRLKRFFFGHRVTLVKVPLIIFCIDSSSNSNCFGQGSTGLNPWKKPTGAGYRARFSKLPGYWVRGRGKVFKSVGVRDRDRFLKPLGYRVRGNRGMFRSNPDQKFWLFSFFFTTTQTQCHQQVKGNRMDQRWQFKH